MQNRGSIKVTYIISDIDKALAFEWVADTINTEKIVLSFILLNSGPSYLENYLFEKGIQVFRIRCRGKKDWPSAFASTYKTLKSLQPDVVHCHLIQANIIGLTAAKFAGIKKRIYTRHHSSLHHVYFKKGVWWDKLANKLATRIVAISGIVKKILLSWEHVPEGKVVLIPHGFLLEGFFEVDNNRVIEFKNRALIVNSTPVVGVISRFTEWKGVQYIIPAFAKFLEQYPSAILMMLNAGGDYEPEIKKGLSSITESSYRLIPFEKDIMAAYKAMDIFIHVPIDEHSEAFGQIYVEALAAGVPSIFTRSGIANDRLFNDANALFVDYKNSDQIVTGMMAIMNDQENVSKRRKAGVELSKRFALKTYIDKLEALYLDNK